MKAPFIYLASASPRRHELLKQMGVEHEVLHVPAPEGEDEPQLPNEAPENYVRRTAREKAIRAQDWLPSRRLGGPSSMAPNRREDVAVLAADTTVVLEGDILGKPLDRADACAMLARLSGKCHTVHTAIALIRGELLLEDVSITEVHFANLTALEIDLYCDTGEPFGKAGAYGIQGRAGIFIKHIVGSYTGVMGLPVFETYRMISSLR